MTYVRVDWVGNYTDGEVVKVEVAGVVAAVPIGDVIELTKEEHISAVISPGDLIQRFVSKWEVH